MPRKRRPSDDVYNARRRVRRLAARLEREGKADRARELRAAASTKSGVTSTELDRIYNASRVAKSNKSATVAQKVVTQTKAPRPKRPSDELHNARRRLVRQAASLERQALKQPDEIAQQMRSFAKSLRSHVEAAKGLKTQEARQEALERLARIREHTIGASYGKSAIYRRNLITMQQLNAAGTKGADSSISERKKDVFWFAVKGLWPDGSDVPRNERYEKIIEHFYFEGGSDAKAFEQWLAKKKGVDMKDISGDLSYIYEYITEELNSPAMYDAPEVGYEEAMKSILTLK